MQCLTKLEDVIHVLYKELNLVILNNVQCEILTADLRTKHKAMNIYYIYMYNVTTFSKL